MVAEYICPCGKCVCITQHIVKRALASWRVSSRPDRMAGIVMPLLIQARIVVLPHNFDGAAVDAVSGIPANTLKNTFLRVPFPVTLLEVPPTFDLLVETILGEKPSYLQNEHLVGVAILLESFAADNSKIALSVVAYEKDKFPSQILFCPNNKLTDKEQNVIYNLVYSYLYALSEHTTKEVPSLGSYRVKEKHGSTQHKINDVVFVTNTRYAQNTEPGHRDIVYSHRWETRGHERHLRSGRVVWVKPHIKGPADKELIRKVRIVKGEQNDRSINPAP